MNFVTRYLKDIPYSGEKDTIIMLEYRVNHNVGEKILNLRGGGD